jgi:ribosomal protein S8
MKKDNYIKDYNRIHKNLSDLEEEIEHRLKNKSDLIGNDDIIKDLKRRVLETVNELKQTRDNERRIFNQ